MSARGRSAVTCWTKWFRRTDAISRFAAIRVERAGAAPVAGAVGMKLGIGNVVVVEGARVSLLYRSGRVVSARRTTRVEVPSDTAPSGLFSCTVGTLAQVVETDARTQPNRQGIIRPIAGIAVPISPRNELPFLADRPTFVWFRVPETTGYVVQIRPVDGEPVRFGTGPDTTWTFPANELPLIEGGVYEWTVASTEAGRPAAVQRFRIASEIERKEISRDLQRISRSGLNPSTDGLFLAALTYRDGGFFYDAAQALDLLERMGSGTGRDFHMLRGEVYDALGWTDLAEREFVRANTGR